MRRRASLLCTAALVLGLVCIAFASRLRLRTDLAELLPADHPAVLALKSIAPRQRSASSLVLLVESGDAAQAQAFLDTLAPRLEALRPAILTEIDWGPDPEPARFASMWRWLYARLDDLSEAERLADALVQQRSSPLYVELDEDPADGLARLARRMKDELPRAPAKAHFASDDGRIVGTRLWRRRDGLGGTGDHAMLEAVRSAVAAADPGRFGVQVRYTGPVAQAVEEQAGVRDDLSLATLGCAALILSLLYLTFGNAWLVLCALAPTLLGLLGALALASFTLGSLNLNTAFLASIILGNGINAPIVFLLELRRARAMSLARALSRAWLRSLRGVSAAMLAASAAYAILGLTRFRGFRQFGLLGGAGMVAVLAATYLVLPPLLFLIGDRLQPGLDRYSPLARTALTWLGRPRPAMLVAAALSLASVIGVVRFEREPVQWNLRGLRSSDGEAARLWPTMEALGMGSVGAGYIANTAVLLVDDPAEADRVAEALLAKDRAHDHVLAQARTITSLLPRDQDAKLEVLARLRERIDRSLSRHGELLSAEERRRLLEARPPEWLRRVTADDLPRAVREAFTETDGQRGRLIGVDADPARHSDWDGHSLLRLARALSVEVDGRRYVAASASTVFAGMLETLVNDAPRLACGALLAVSVLCVLLFGTAAAPVLGALLLGLFWLLGLAGLFGLHLNFMSFAALPISIGVGADYAANLWSREEPSPTAPIASTILLCSLTTVIGYSSLLIGRNGALRSFGLLCDLGELTCILAALLSPLLFRALRGQAVLA